MNPSRVFVLWSDLRLYNKKPCLAIESRRSEFGEPAVEGDKLYQEDFTCAVVTVISGACNSSRLL
jgi:hypothetical protein